MRDHAQRLAWLETLIKRGSESQTMTERHAALVITTSIKPLAIPFTTIKQVIPGTRLQPLPFIPQEFCGVVDFEGALYPILTASKTDEIDEGSKLVLLEGKACSFGILFDGTSQVIDLNDASDKRSSLEENERTHLHPLVAQELLVSPDGPLILLDVEATAAALLALE